MGPFLIAVREFAVEFLFPRGHLGFKPLAYFRLVLFQAVKLVLRPRALFLALSFGLLKLGLPLDIGNVLHKGSKGPVSLIDPLAIRPGAVSSPCPVGAVVFPHYEADSEPAIEPMSRAAAMFELVQLSFNFTKFRDRGLDLLAQVLRNATCVRVRSGELQATCRLLECWLHRHQIERAHA